MVTNEFAAQLDLARGTVLLKVFGLFPVNREIVSVP